MARHLFGLAPSDLATEAVGDQLKLRPAAIGTVWDALTGGSQIMDLQDLTLSPITVITADADARVGFWGPDNVTLVYVDFDFGRFAMVATTIGAAIQSKLDSSGGAISGDLNVQGNLDTDGTSVFGGAAAFGASVVAVGTVQSDNALRSALVQGSTSPSGNLTLSSTSDVTKGQVRAQDPLVARAGFSVSAGVGRELYVRRTTDLPRASTTTLTADPTLTVNVEANSTYEVEMLLIFDGANAAGALKFDFTSPASSVLNFTDSSGTLPLYVTAGVPVYAGLGVGVKRGILVKGLLRTAGTAGAFTLRWAQNVSSATNTTLFTDSYLKLLRVA